MHKLAILCGGGPAPGINSVIGAATICAALAGAGCSGIRDGLQVAHARRYRARDAAVHRNISRIHFTGGSYIGTSRANPTKDSAAPGSDHSARSSAWASTS